ncbi:NAD-dependent epimerase/dehydratase family protein [uncultured Desulfobacter sp.]|uniref:NAD-dependent epimerase/dehydratase family protein n=1 Tax=uncultured Desulfobacter sp. TaxID=240139 RepID=UPI002AAB0235|nr:NAD-dependent epimerase/dehydratase family protein [uncultured Desulfobacter sp.]
MKVFITGIAGFIGSALAAKLISEGHEVAGIDNLFTGIGSNVPDKAQWVVGDIINEKDFEHLSSGYDVVVHTAAQTSGEKSFELPLYDLDTNIKGSYNTFEFAKSSGARLLINFSSMSVYGHVTTPQAVDEKYPPNPASLYGNSKLAAEKMLTLLSNRDGLPVISFRLFNAYGPGQNFEELKQGMISIYLAQLLQNQFDKVLVKGSLDRVRDFVFLDDIIDILMTAIIHDTPSSGVFNLSTGTTTSVRELLRHLVDISGINKKIVSKGSTPGDIQGFAGDNSLITKSFCWRPQTDIRAGLEKMINFYLGKDLNE